MDRIPLKAEEREILGKKVKRLRQSGIIPGHVFGNKVKGEAVSVSLADFMRVYKQAGETGLVDLKIGAEKIRPVLIRDLQLDPIKGMPLHVDFYQVNLSEKVTVPVPVVLIGEELELVHSGEAVLIQPLNEVSVETLPTEIPEKIEVDTSNLKQIGDSILVSQLQVPEGVTVLAEAEAVVAKLDTAITEEMKKLMEEQAAEAAAAAAEAQAEAGETAEGETPTEGEAPTEGGEAEAKEGESQTPETPAEENK